MQGELAIAFGELLRKLWSTGQNTVAPRAFKTKLARFAPQFSGYNQHDSQVSHVLQNSLWCMFNSWRKYCVSLGFFTSSPTGKPVPSLSLHVRYFSSFFLGNACFPFGWAP